MPPRRGAVDHGASRVSAETVGKFRQLKESDVAGVLQSQLRSYQRMMTRTAAYYANERVSKGLSAVPKYVLSDHLFKEYKFSVSWMPPNPCGYVAVPNGGIRRWLFVAFHSFGASFDKGFLKKNPGVLSVPVDKDGHNPRRFFAAMRYLTEWSAKPAAVGVHFGISRRGDWVNSVDLNDIAYATGGDYPLPFGKNVYSIGFEFEEHQARYIPGSKKRTSEIYRQPYTEKQILSLAIGLKKINTWRQVITDSNGDLMPWLSTGEAILEAYNARRGGMIQHLTVHPRQRTDVGAQFMVPRGKKISFGSSLWNVKGDNATNGPGPLMESGWDTLNRLFRKLRGVKRETQVFQSPLSSQDLMLAKASEAVGAAGNRAQYMAARSGRDHLAGLSRSSKMQQQSRQALYSKATAANVALASTIGRANGVISSVIQRFDTSTVEGVSGAVMFSETEGTWEDGES